MNVLLEFDAIQLNLIKGALATSGNYRHYIEAGGKQYGHILDPRTGYPSESDVLSASVIAPDCLTADALATAIIVGGSSFGKDLITGNPDPVEGFESGASGVAIDDDNFVYITQQDVVVKYSVIEDDDGTLSLKEEYASPPLDSGGDVSHLFIEDNYVERTNESKRTLYAIRGSELYMTEDTGQNFDAVSSIKLDNKGSGIVVSGMFATALRSN